MSVGPLVTEISVTFAIVAFLLYRYGNWSRHHILVTINVFIAWYFAFIIISILPLDVSTTAYKQCLKNREPIKVLPTDPFVPIVNGTTVANVSSLTLSSWLSNITDGSTTVSNFKDTPLEECQVPWSHIPEGVLPVLWRVVYWTAQALTWIILPMMQSYSTAGNFTIAGKLKTALVENAIYYGTYLLIFIVLLIYVALLPNINLGWSQLVVICITASNTWGLFLLVLLLGYSLVEIPRSCWNKSKRGYTLSYMYFKAAKLSAEKCEAEERLEDVLEEIQQVSDSTSASHQLRRHVETILSKCPEEKKLAMNRRRPQVEDNQIVPGAAVTEKNLVRLHQQVIRALQAHHRTQCMWNLLVEKVFHWEDVTRNELSPERRFKATFPVPQSSFYRLFCSPSLEWYWNCLLRSWVLRFSAVVLSIFSLMVIWSEMTFFTHSPTLSIFALMMEKAKTNYDYVFIELLSMCTIAYLCVCAYYTVFRVRVFNYYYLAPHQQTDEYSLIFSGMMLCRLTPPLCLNFLGLIHLDSHVTKDAKIVETAYTGIMGHMDVIAIIADGFNIYFPITICLLCLATYFHCGSRLLHMLGFEQFIGDDDMTTDLIEEGRDLIKREKVRRQRNEENEIRKRNKLVGSAAKKTSPRHTGLGQMFRTPSEENARAELLRDVEPIDYTEERAGRIFDEIRAADNGDPYLSVGKGDSYHRSVRNTVGNLPRGIFDDV